jgi:hypothetical protein
VIGDRTPDTPSFIGTERSRIIHEEIAPFVSGGASATPTPTRRTRDPYRHAMPRHIRLPFRDQTSHLQGGCAPLAICASIHARSSHQRALSTVRPGPLADATGGRHRNKEDQQHFICATSTFPLSIWMVRGMGRAESVAPRSNISSIARLEDYRIGQVIAKGSFGADIRQGRYYKKHQDEQRSFSSKKSSKSSYLDVSMKCVSKRSLLLVRWYKNNNSYLGILCVPRLYACFHEIEHVVTMTEFCTGGSLQVEILSLSNDASFFCLPCASTTPSNFLTF